MRLGLLNTTVTSSGPSARVTFAQNNCWKEHPDPPHPYKMGFCASVGWAGMTTPRRRAAKAGLLFMDIMQKEWRCVLRDVRLKLTRGGGEGGTGIIPPPSEDPLQSWEKAGVYYSQLLTNTSDHPGPSGHSCTGNVSCRKVRDAALEVHYLRDKNSSSVLKIFRLWSTILLPPPRNAHVGTDRCRKSEGTLARSKIHHRFWKLDAKYKWKASFRKEKHIIYYRRNMKHWWGVIYLVK